MKSSLLTNGALPPGLRLLRTFPTNNYNKQTPEQTSLEADSNHKNSIIAKINEQMKKDETGRLFSVVYLRGKQHKVTPGE